MKCTSCGAEASPGRARCEYCDAPLQEARALEVQWTARGRDGVAGRGLVAVTAAPDFSAEQLRAKAEAAFAAALDDTGAKAGADQVSAAMRERLTTMLGPGIPLQACEVQAITTGDLPAPAPAPGAGMGPVVCRLFAALFLVSLALCSGMCGLGGLINSRDHSAKLAMVETAEVMGIPKAREASGPVCIESHVPIVETPLRHADVPLLYLAPGPGKSKPEHVAAFRLNRLEVTVTSGTVFEPLEEIGPEPRDQRRGFPAEKAITVAGVVNQGTLRAELVTTHATKAELVSWLREKASNDRVFGISGLVACVVLGVLALVMVFRRGKKS